MADQDSGTKTEKATPKKLRDARDKGDIAKSRDLTNTLLLMFGILLFWQLGPTIGSQLATFTELVMFNSPTHLKDQLNFVGTEAIKLLLSICAMLVLPMAAFGMLSEFAQTGVIFTGEKVKPKLSNLNPVSGLQKMFSTDSLFELFKSVIKISIVITIATYTAISILPDALKLQNSDPISLALLLQTETIMLFGWSMGIFITVAVLDFSYQKYSHEKKMRMSLQDIKQEHKNSEGDPQVKGQRQQLAREWAQEGAAKQAREATVLIVNPTHVAIALKYDKNSNPVPTVCARGVDEIALAMRHAAQSARVPVLLNIKLARHLLAETENGQIVPHELFDIVAEVILWANDAEKRLNGTTRTDQTNVKVPGEDLSEYSANNTLPSYKTTHPQKGLKS